MQSMNDFSALPETAPSKSTKKLIDTLLQALHYGR